MSEALLLGKGTFLSYETLFKAGTSSQKVELTQESVKEVQKSHEFLQSEAKRRVIYGINTGFGDLSKVRISTSELGKLQKRLLMSHASGSGEWVPLSISKMALISRLHSLALGSSGVSLELLNRVKEMINRGSIPLVPKYGSVGASGDLIPLAHLFLPLLGLGKIYHKGKVMSGKEYLQDISSPPYELKPKEGLGLINGTSFSAALTTAWLYPLKKLLHYSLIALGLSLIASKGLKKHYRVEFANLKPHPGLRKTYQLLEELLRGNEWESSDDVQDAYSYRCSPHAYGYAFEFLEWAEEVLNRELNSVTDNPLIHGEEVLEGGNFHGNYLSMISDHARAVMVQLGEVSFWRINRIIDPRLNRGLPPFLGGEPGIDSGFMISHYLASSSLAEMKALATPLAINNVPVSALKEDWITYSQSSSWFTLEALDRLLRIVSVELMIATQGITLRLTNGEELKLGGPLKEAYESLKKLFPSAYRSSDEEEPLYELQERFIKWLEKETEYDKIKTHLRIVEGRG